VNAEFNWWLLIVGLVVGAGLVWYVLMDARRRDIDVTATERPREAAWLSAALADEGWDVPPEAAERLLDLHRAYLDAPPPDAAPEISPEGDQPDAATLDAPMAPDGDAPEAPDAPEARDAPAGAVVTGSEVADDDGVGLRS
jgi:hypothetical protein